MVNFEYSENAIPRAEISYKYSRLTAVAGLAGIAVSQAFLDGEFMLVPTIAAVGGSGVSLSMKLHLNNLRAPAEESVNGNGDISE